MTLVRDGSGPVPTLRALASQVHPVFMLPPIAASWFGATLSGSFSVGLGVTHAVAVFAGLYTAHLKDGYVDFHLRGEDDDHPLTARGCRVAMAGATAVFFGATVALGALVGPVAALVTLPGWVIGSLHAPQLDTNPVTATTGYPLGIAFALVGGHYVQARGFAPVVLAFAGVFLVVLSGIKVIDDAGDYEYDRSIEKRTVAVALGRVRARRTAYGLMALGLVAVLALSALSVFPPGTAVAAIVFAAVATLARRTAPERATKLLIRGSYLFLAVLVATVWFRPLG